MMTEQTDTLREQVAEAIRPHVPLDAEHDLADAVLAVVRPVVDALTAERDRNKRAAETLGGVVEEQCRMILDITGLHDWIGEDGDGDWGAVWENAYELLPRAEKAEAAIDRARALADEWYPGTPGPRRMRSWAQLAYEKCARDLRAALDGDS